MFLLTGAPGWIGNRLVRALIQGLPGMPEIERPPRLRCLVDPCQDPARLPCFASVAVATGDLRRMSDLKAFCKGGEGATLFHCAGLVHPRRRVRELMEVNVTGTRNLMQAAEDAGVRRIVALSSNSPMGANASPTDLFDEESLYRPYRAYGRSKMLMEQVVQEFQARGRIETVLLRPTWFYGPDQPERQTTFFRMIRRGKAPILGTGENRRSMTYVDNLCQAMLLCHGCPAASGQTYWVSDARAYPFKEIVDTVERLMETEFRLSVTHERLRLPSWLGSLAGVADALIQTAGLYHQKIHVLSEMHQSIACSIEKASRDLGYAPTVEIEEGMRRSLAWCLEKGIPL